MTSPTAPVHRAFEPTEAFARSLDAADPLARFRERFHVPAGSDGPVVYLCGNSLGLQPVATEAAIARELEDWRTLAVAAHTRGRRPWLPYHEFFSDSLGRLVGAGPDEVVAMNSLTVNIHLMLVTFFQPQGRRNKVLIEHPTFPSDLYAVRTHVATRGLDPDECVLIARPREGEHAIRTEDLEALLAERGDEIALVWLSGVNYFTGQVFDMQRLTAAARARGSTVGYDLAHAAGNVPLHLHDWEVDFACWCSYKYLNGGPGAIAGCYVHERHGRNPNLPRFAGWWGDDPATRFQMHLKRDFVPQPGAAGWQVSNPPIFAMTPLRCSLDLFDDATMPALREKSTRLTGYLRYLLQRVGRDRVEIITPADAQGCQLSLLVHDDPRGFHERLTSRDIVCDFREPNVMRAAPVPLYNTYHDVWRFADTLRAV